ncbi:hypothetical protein [Aquirufa nivalisilvae]|uniref:hypothetical protein n=1 Tax=Aquirufa nivalisilvae TaxID=2516557 RepID=UPI001375E882|nr:hypothetical protein [Aquirufa nivalisilvae]
MKNDHTSLQSENVTTQISNEKKKWVEPQINAWEYVNLGFKYGFAGADAGTKTSAT